MSTIENLLGCAFIGAAAVSSLLFFSAPAAPVVAPAPKPAAPSMPVPLLAFSKSCAAAMNRHGALLYVQGSGAPASRAAHCRCIAKGLGQRYQDPRSAAFAKKQVEALIVSDKRNMRNRRLFAVARGEARRQGVGRSHRQGVAQQLYNSALRCGRARSGARTA